MIKCLTISFVVFFISCSDKREIPIEFIHYRGHDLLYKVKGSKKIMETEDSIKYVYASFDSSYLFPFKNKKRDSSKFFFDAKLKFVEGRTFQLNGEMFKISRYDYEDPYGDDGGMKIFCNDSDDIVAIKSASWSHLILLEKGDDYERELFNIFLNDTTGFVTRKGFK